jgi:hypothetical protein
MPLVTARVVSCLASTEARQCRLTCLRVEQGKIVGPTPSLSFPGVGLRIVQGSFGRVPVLNVLEYLGTAMHLDLRTAT